MCGLDGKPFGSQGTPHPDSHWGRGDKFLEDNGLWLPSKVFWEYACRAGGSEKRYGPIDQVAWYAGNAKSAQDVGKKRPNAFGLYDMLGNVAEFVGFDGYPYYDPNLMGIDMAPPPGGEPGDFVVGGSWKDPAEKCVGYANIATFLPDFQRSGAVGFRVARFP